MSQWTHVAGIIRLDCMRFGEDAAFLQGVKDAFGHTYHYDPRLSDDEYLASRKRCNVPAGSEGSVQYAVQKTGRQSPEGGEVSWGVVYIWGDLRDYSDITAVYLWVKRALKRLETKWGTDVRQCAIKVDVEYHGSFMIHDVIDNKGHTRIIMEGVISQ